MLKCLDKVGYLLHKQLELSYVEALGDILALKVLVEMGWDQQISELLTSHRLLKDFLPIPVDLLC